MSGIFENCRVYVAPCNLFRKRIDIVKNNVTKYGGAVVEKLDTSLYPTHIVFDETFMVKKCHLERVLKLINVTVDNIPSSSKVLSVEWLCKCVKAQELLPTEPFEFRPTVPEPDIEPFVPGYSERTYPGFKHNRSEAEDPRGDAWLGRMTRLRGGFFATGILPLDD